MHDIFLSETNRAFVSWVLELSPYLFRRGANQYFPFRDWRCLRWGGVTESYYSKRATRDWNFGPCTVHLFGTGTPLSRKDSCIKKKNSCTYILTCCSPPKLHFALFRRKNLRRHLIKCLWNSKENPKKEKKPCNRSVNKKPNLMRRKPRWD